MINPISMNALQAVKITEPISSSHTTPAEVTKSFGDFLKGALDSVSSQEQQVSKMNDQYILGKVDVSQVMIASQQAELSLQLTSQVRNKVIEAYQDIMRMQM